MKNTLPDDFPRTKSDWERVVKAATGEDRSPVLAESVDMQHAVMVHGGGFAAVREALAKRRRGLGKKPAKQQVTLRIEPDILARWKATGTGWQTRIAKVLAENAPAL